MKEARWGRFTVDLGVLALCPSAEGSRLLSLSLNNVRVVLRHPLELGNLMTGTGFLPGKSMGRRAGADKWTQ